MIPIPVMLVMIFSLAVVVGIIWLNISVNRDWDYYVKHGVPPRGYFTDHELDEMDRLGFRWPE
jgi:hypothetical protein